MSSASNYPFDFDNPPPFGYVPPLDGLDPLLYHSYKTGHQKWGFAIFRCTYGDDEAWLSFVQILKDAAHASLEFYGREWIEPPRTDCKRGPKEAGWR